MRKLRPPPKAPRSGASMNTSRRQLLTHLDPHIVDATQRQRRRLVAPYEVSPPKVAARANRLRRRMTYCCATVSALRPDFIASEVGAENLWRGPASLRRWPPPTDRRGDRDVAYQLARLMRSVEASIALPPALLRKCSRVAVAPRPSLQLRQVLRDRLAPPRARKRTPRRAADPCSTSRRNSLPPSSYSKDQVWRPFTTSTCIMAAFCGRRHRRDRAHRRIRNW